MFRGSVFVLVCSSLAFLCFVTSSDAYIYWASYDSGNGRIGRADMDGTGVDGSIVSGIYYGAGVATDGSHIYWGESGSSPSLAAIGRADPDGSNANHAFLSGGTYCGIFGVRADKDAIFWLKSTCSPGNQVIDRYDSGGYGSAGGGSYACGFDVDDTYVYWSEGQYIARGLRSGGSIDHTWLNLGPGNAACGVAVSKTHVYWTVSAPATNFRGRSIGRASINGAESTIDSTFINGTVFTGGSTPPGIAVEGDYLYWTNQPDYVPGSPTVNGSVGRATLAGTGIEQDFVPSIFFPVGLDVDSKGAAPRAPRVSRPSVSNPVFVPLPVYTPTRPRAAATARATPKGTVFSFKVDRAAKTSIAIQRRNAGRKVRGKCVKRTRKNSKKPKCDLTLATLIRNTVAGTNEVPFSGRIKGKGVGRLTLKPGRYKAAFTAKAGGKKSKTVSVGFKVARR